MRMMPKNMKPKEELPHITRQEFCDNMDEILERVDKEKIAFVITDEKHGDLALCPAEWYDIRFSENFRHSVVFTLKYSFWHETEKAQKTADFILESIPFLDMETLQEIIQIIEVELSSTPKLGPIPQEPIWKALLKGIMDEYDATKKY